MAMDDEPLWIPYNPMAVQPSSVDCFLDRVELPSVVYPNSWILGPKECALACTVEHFNLPNNVRGRVEGKSTWGRKFLDVHSTAGYIDAGFKGNITLELFNKSDVPIVLVHGVAICQIEFAWLDQIADPGYNGKYQNQTGVTPPR